ncbi:hypothetical protein FKM82_018253 [Ascaphus truei]
MCDRDTHTHGHTNPPPTSQVLRMGLGCHGKLLTPPVPHSHHFPLLPCLTPTTVFISRASLPLLSSTPVPHSRRCPLLPCLTPTTVFISRASLPSLSSTPVPHSRRCLVFATILPHASPARVLCSH